MDNLNAPQFVENDLAQILQEMAAQYEKETGKTLYPAQIDQLLINIVAYREGVVRSAIQDAALQNLVQYARAPAIDCLAAFYGLTRLAATPAIAEMRWQFDEPPEHSYVFAAGEIVVEAATTKDVFKFANESDLIILAGSTHFDYTALCQTAGAAANDIAAGDINRANFVFPDALKGKFFNVSATTGGAQEETDERLRVRLLAAPEKFSMGSAARYKAVAMAQNQNIADAAVFSPTSNGAVHVVLLGYDGKEVGDALRLKVLNALNDERERMLGDKISVFEAESVDYELKIGVTLKKNAVADLALLNLKKAAVQFADDLQQTLGADIVPSAFLAALNATAADVYSVEILSPTEPRELSVYQYPKATAISVEVLGVANE